MNKKLLALLFAVAIGPISGMFATEDGTPPAEPKGKGSAFLNGVQDGFAKFGYSKDSNGNYNKANLLYGVPAALMALATTYVVYKYYVDAEGTLHSAKALATCDKQEISNAWEADWMLVTSYLVFAASGLTIGVKLVVDLVKNRKPAKTDAEKIADLNKEIKDLTTSAAAEKDADEKKKLTKALLAKEAALKVLKTKKADK